MMPGVGVGLTDWGGQTKSLPQTQTLPTPWIIWLGRLQKPSSFVAPAPNIGFPVNLVLNILKLS